MSFFEAQRGTYRGADSSRAFAPPRNRSAGPHQYAFTAAPLSESALGTGVMA